MGKIKRDAGYCRNKVAAGMEAKKAGKGAVQRKGRAQQ